MEINQLVSKVKQGDSDAFGLIYDQFVQRIFRYIRLKIQDRQVAEDILQDVFLKAYQGIYKLKTEDLNFSAWLYRIASNTINDYFREKYRKPETLEIDENFDIAGCVSLQKELEIKFDIENAKKAFELLSPLHKQVLELRFIQEFSPEETAKILHKSNLAIRLIQFRALKKVQIILKGKQ